MSVEEKLKSDLGIDPERYMNDVVMSDDYATFNISPNIDLSCGGGIREGTVTIVRGKEKLGKSTFCLQMAANAQNHPDGLDRKIIYLDVENKVEKRDLKGIHNLIHDDLSRFELVGSIEGKIITAERAFKYVENLISTHTNLIIVFDSISMLLTESESNYDFTSGKTYMSNCARFSAIFFRKMAQLMRPTKNTLLAITHDYAWIVSNKITCHKI